MTSKLLLNSKLLFDSKLLFNYKLLSILNSCSILNSFSITKLLNSHSITMGPIEKGLHLIRPPNQTGTQVEDVDLLHTAYGNISIRLTLGDDEAQHSRTGALLISQILTFSDNWFIEFRAEGLYALVIEGKVRNPEPCTLHLEPCTLNPAP